MVEEARDDLGQFRAVFRMGDEVVPVAGDTFESTH
jgi:hypothetical protein